MKNVRGKAILPILGKVFSPGFIFKKRQRDLLAARVLLAF
jgi:hypothetical protein